MATENRAPMLRLGMVGLGLAGSIMAMNLRGHPRVRISAACDLNERTLAAFADDFGAFTTTDLDELLERTDIDAVYIATPHQFHCEHAVRAAARGKHMVIEKPLALTLDECDRIAAAGARHGVRILVGHTHSYDPAVAKMAALIRADAFGPLRMINTWNYTNFLYRPRRPEELDTSRGGGILFNQVPHQIDTLRLLAGAPVRSVRAATGVWDTGRPTEGACQAFLEFTNDVTATLVYSGYDYFDSDELHQWIGEGGREKPPGNWGAARRALAGIASPQEEAARRQAAGYGAAPPPALGTGPQHQPHFGITVVSCEAGELRASADGVYCHTAQGRQEISLPASYSPIPGWGEVLEELCGAVFEETPPVHDAAWGRETLRVCLALLESGTARREVFL